MEESILTSTKQVLGIDELNTAFDLDVITHINHCFSNLNTLGIGPATGFVIEDDSTEWADFIDVEDPFYANLTSLLSSVKTYVYLKTSILFDPPAMGYLIDLKNKQIDETIFRLTVLREEVYGVEPPIEDAV